MLLCLRSKSWGTRHGAVIDQCDERRDINLLGELAEKEWVIGIPCQNNIVHCVGFFTDILSYWHEGHPYHMCECG